MASKALKAVALPAGRMRAGQLARPAVALVVAAMLFGALPTTTAIGSPTVAPDAPEMEEYQASEFREAAAELPEGLVAAVERDLGVSAEEYLAQAAAASDASDLAEHLAALGIDASDRRLDGTTLTIGVETAAEAVVVDDAGAVAVVGALPPPEPIADDVIFEPAIDVYGGDVITWQPSSGGAFRCSVGVNGTNASNQPELVTAGHCTSASLGNGGLYRHIVASTPGFSPSGGFVNIGTPRAGSFQAGGGYDVGLLAVTQSGFTTPPTVTTFTLGQGARSGGLLPVRDTIIPTTGSPICKSGATTGWTCGHITSAIQQNLTVTTSPTSSYTVDAIVTSSPPHRRRRRG